MSMLQNILINSRLMLAAAVIVAVLCVPAFAQNQTAPADNATEQNATEHSAITTLTDNGTDVTANTQPQPSSPTDKDGLNPDDIIFQGKVYSSRKQEVSTSGAGKIKDILVKVGDPVKENQPLVTIELLDVAYKQFLDDVSTDPLIDIKTKLAEVDAEITQAQQDLKEIQVLAENDFAAPATVNQQRTKLDLLQRKRESIARTYDNAKTAIENRVESLKEVLGDEVKFDHVPKVVAVEAPFDGHVLRLNPELYVGQTVPKDLNVAIVGVLDPMVIRAHLFELEASRIAPGEKCYFTLGSYPDRQFPAEVSYIALTPISPGLDQPSYYEVELTAPNPDLLLREGFKVEVVIKK